MKHNIMSMRGLIDGFGELVGRSRLANIAGHTYHGKRDLYKALGYKRELFPADYRSRYKRNAVANRLVKALPKASWRGGAEIIEDEDPRTLTTFEAAFNDMNERLKIWNVLQRADILAGLGRYAIILIGGPGNMNEPLDRCTAEDIKYLMPYSEEDAKVYRFDIDPTSPRFGLPTMYNITRTSMMSPEATNSNVLAKQVHWTRVIHIADGLLDDRLYGEPRLECVWNDLDNLEKVAGGGAEAFWRRADGGTQYDLDPTIDFDDDEDPAGSSTPTNAARTSGMKKQIEEVEHGFRRNILTRGVTVTRMGSDVADFKSPVESIVSLISAGTGIPQRVLMGSEQAKLAASMDRSNWDDRVADRREELCGPMFVRPMLDRFILWGALPKPKDYIVGWGQLKVLDEKQRAEIAVLWSQLNATEIVVSADEIRDRVLGLPKKADSGGDFTPPPTAAMFTRKFKMLSREKQEYYMARLQQDTPESRVSQWVSEAVTAGRKVLAARPELTAAIAANDRAEISRLLDEALNTCETEVRTAAAAALPPTVNVEVTNIPAAAHAPARVRVSKRVEYQNIDGQMRPVRIVEEE